MATDSKRKLSKLSGPIHPSKKTSMESLRMDRKQSSSKYSSINNDAVDSQVALVNDFNDRNAQANFYFSTGQHMESIQNLRSNHKMPTATGVSNSRSDLTGSMMLKEDSCLLPKKKMK